MLIVLTALSDALVKLINSFNNHRNIKIMVSLLFIADTLLMRYIDAIHLEMFLYLLVADVILIVVVLLGNEEKDYFLEANLVMATPMILYLMKESNEYFFFCMICTLFIGVLSAMIYKEILQWLFCYSLFGCGPWIIIMHSYDFSTSSSTNQISINKDIMLSLGVITALCSFCYFMIRQKDKVSHDLAEALLELQQKHSQIKAYSSQLKQSLQDKENFILLLSHETRNPLNILMGNLTLLITEAKDKFPQLLDKLNRCHFCSELLLQYINNILDSGKLKNHGELDVTTTSTNLNEFLLKNWKLLEMMILKKNLTPKLSVINKLPAYVKIDSQRVTQVLLNLVGNATKFTELGSVALHVSHLGKLDLDFEKDFDPSGIQAIKLATTPRFKNRTHPDPSLLEEEEDINSVECSEGKAILTVQENDLGRAGSMRNAWPGTTKPFLDQGQGRGFLKFEVTDTGCGMDQKSCSQLFQKFKQFHSDSQKRSAGTGLGLWISKNLCEAMKGGIKAFSRKGKGTCFVAIVEAAECLPVNYRYAYATASLKLVPHQNMSESSKSIPTKADATDKSSKNAKRVLLADDEVYNLDYHAKILERLGFDHIDAVINGKELVNTFISKPMGYYQYIISDIKMPLVSGTEAIIKIREFEKVNRYAPTPVGFITGHANAKCKEECLSDPIRAVFLHSKPINIELLQGLLSDVTIKSDYLTTLQSVSKNSLALKRACVLCVDDDLFNLEYLKDALDKLNVSTLLATNGFEALDIVKAHNRDIKLILMDCNMPKKDGWSASYDIKTYLKEDNLCDIPIYGVSGNDATSTETKFADSQMDGLFAKPLSTRTLHQLSTSLQL